MRSPSLKFGAGVGEFLWRDSIGVEQPARTGGCIHGIGQTHCQPLRSGQIFYEHCNPDWISKDNSLSNCAVLTKTCWRIKTSSYDLPTIAKVKRVRDAWRGIDGAGRPMDGSRRSRFKVHVNGAVDIRPGR